MYLHIINHYIKLNMIEDLDIMSNYKIPKLQYDTIIVKQWFEIL